MSEDAAAVPVAADKDVPIQPRSWPSPLRWNGILISMAALALVYAGRGWVLAWMLNGRYLWSSLIVDGALLALVVLILRLVHHLVRDLANRCFGKKTRFRRLAAAGASFAICFFLAAPFLIVLLQLHPQKIGCGAGPSEFGLRSQDATLDSDGLGLATWDIPAGSAERPVVLICHGVGANRQSFLPVAEMMHGLDYHVCLFDFRGHGDSDGRMTTFGVRESHDVKAAFDHVRSKYPSSKIYGLGYSMGGAALLKMAAEHGGFDSIVLDCTFARAENVAKYSVLWFFGPTKTPMWHIGRFWGWVLAGVDFGDHNPEEYIAAIADCPILLIHGTADKMIPSTESVRLQAAAGNHAQLWLIHDAGHLEAMEDPDYATRLRRFFEEK
jgi:pimeloyl-ACP methyl ester carboxylesterase